MKKSVSSIIWTILLVILVLIIAGGALAEFGLRHYIGNQLKSSYAQQATATGAATEAEPSIEFSATPLLFSVATGSVPHVAVDTPSTLSITYPQGADGAPVIEGMPAATVTIDNLDISDPNAPIAESLTVDTAVPDTFILAQIQQAMAEQTAGDDDGFGAQLFRNLVKVTDVNANAATGNLDVVFTNGAAVLSLKPEVAKGNMTFTADNASILGFDLPESVSTVITDAIGKQSADMAATGMEIVSATVGDDGLGLTLHGSNVNINTIDTTY
ncbi:LmeA family phospholipid-binding protein [Corynebacterium mendelii]|uniref:LmeA family phospholipid-binding protein n=1 Tax=Corynebacterium mendelii TaxID=2765362 RepID=A0A939ITH6_9CORY|nr:LmeA family phospholipid-binding protein [Corynebacterium mendelii]MBN9643864.1 LmeA family phospholipid-binding protein [Corynebacterium mendelii]